MARTDRVWATAFGGSEAAWRMKIRRRRTGAYALRLSLRAAFIIKATAPIGQKMLGMMVK